MAALVSMDFFAVSTVTGRFDFQWCSAANCSPIVQVAAPNGSVGVDRIRTVSADPPRNERAARWRTG
jgi:hypothetical protein